MISFAAIFGPIIRGDPRGWQGLPPDLTLAQVTADFPRDSDWTGVAQIGALHREAGYLWVDMPGVDMSGAGEKLRVWIDGDRVILLDLTCSHVRMDPDLFPESPTTLDTWRGTLPMPKSEIVFPANGLAAFVNRETKSIWHLALFPAVTLETYLNDLRLDMQTRRHHQRL